MLKRHQVYKSKCGAIVEVLNGCDGELSCCGEPMVHLAENTVDAAKEKHVPVIEPVEGGYSVKVGSVSHPMEEKHLIQWIELIAGDTVYRQHLKPGEEPQATFLTSAKEVSARAYCNLHGNWKG